MPGSQLQRPLESLFRAMVIAQLRMTDTQQLLRFRCAGVGFSKSHRSSKGLVRAAGT
jgi:hypothetical protein